MVHSFKSAYQFGKEQEILYLDYVNKKFSNTVFLVTGSYTLS